ncbi:MAG: sugar ABC transporter substrate-binding protein [Limnochordaceae bacterium]|nr:sugar ABC transporter substrate-binding protein [Limnochordaceae bacterium]
MSTVRRILSCVAMVVAVALPCVGSTALAKTVITFWSVSYPTEWQSVINSQLIPAFEKANPDIQVNHVPITWDTLGDKLTVGIATGTAPDLVHYGGSGIFTESMQNRWYPLNDFMKDWKDKDQFEPAVWSLYSRNGLYYGIPLQISPRGIAYNKRLLSDMGLNPDQTPKSWSKIIDIARKGTIVKGNLVVQLGYDTYWDPFATVQNYEHLLVQAGGSPVSEDGRKATLNTEAGRSAFRMLKELYDLSNPTGLAHPDKYDAYLFANEQAVMVRGLAWTLSVVYWTNRKMMKDVGVFAPQQSEATQPVLQGTVDGLAVPATSKHPREAFLFATFLANRENSYRYNEYAGGVSPRRDSVAMAVQADSYLKPFYPWLQYLTVASPYPYQSEGLLDQLKQGLAGKLAPEQVVLQGESEAQKALDKWWKGLPTATRQ